MKARAKYRGEGEGEERGEECEGGKKEKGEGEGEEGKEGKGEREGGREHQRDRERGGGERVVEEDIRWFTNSQNRCSTLWNTQVTETVSMFVFL